MGDNTAELSGQMDNASLGRRAGARASVQSKVPLQCLVDGDGMMPFDGQIVDFSEEGIGFLVHASEITLDQGTLLRGCVVDIPGKRSFKFDLEVCYSQPIAGGEGVAATRSGCRFVNADESTRELIRLFLSFQPEA